MILKFLMFLFILVPLASFASEEGSPVLFRAHILNIGLDPENLPRAGELGSFVLIRVEVDDVLLGVLPTGERTIRMHMGGWPADKRLFNLVVLGVDADKEIKVVSWAYEMQGICIGQDAARKLGIEEEINDLYKNGKLKCTGSR